VAYVRPDVSGNEDIWVMNADGSDQHRLTSNPGRDIYPSWSPDGKEIVFVTGRLAGANLWLMNADGSDQRPLTDIGKDTEPSWGSNGLIAFSRGKGDRHDIFVVMPDGSGLLNLTKNRSPDDLAPSWSPDGKRLAFVSELDGDYEIWVMNEDGAGLHQLTHGFARVGRRVTWSPSGKLLAFSALTD
jgi:Tol biopolymer transport system component